MYKLKHLRGWRSNEEGCYYFHAALFSENTAMNSKYSTAWITCLNIFETLKVAKMILSVCFTTKLRPCGHLLIVWWLKTNSPTKITRKYYKPVKTLPSSCNMKKIVRWHELTLSYYFFHNIMALSAVLWLNAYLYSYSHLVKLNQKHN